MNFTLRPYQQAFCRNVVDGFTRGVAGQGPFSRQLGIAATGAGKTIIASALIYWMRKRELGRSLMLADTDELVQQAREKIYESAGLICDVEKAQDRASMEGNIVVGSIQTLARRHERFPADHFRLVIADEAHLSMSKSWQDVLGRFNAGGAWILGITATPERGDGQKLMTYYEHIAAEIGLFDLINAGHLAPLTVQVCPIQIDATGIETKKTGVNKGEFDAEDLEATIEPYWEAIIDEWQQHASDRKTLVFHPSIKASERFTSLMRARGIEAQHVAGVSKDRAAIIRGFSTGSIQVLNNAQLLTKGFDSPSISCIINLRPTKSRTQYLQMIGRGTRTAPGKTDCIAEGTPILTDQGLVPIEKVTKSMRVWDGTCFVNHDGAICKGEQECITYQGLTATPDHQVWTEKGWQLWSTCAAEQIPVAVTGIGGHPIRTTESRYTRGAQRQGRHKDVHGVHDMRRAVVEKQRFAPQRDGGMPGVRTTSQGAEMAYIETRASQATMRKPKRPSMERLRRARNPVQVRDGSCCLLVGSRESQDRSVSADRQDREQRALRAREPKSIDETTEPCEYEEATSLGKGARIQDCPSGGPLCGFHFEQAACDGPDRSGDYRAVAPTVVQTKRRVWDILNAGPLHRFTAGGLLVHNCLILDFLWQFQELGVMRPAALLGDDEDQEEAVAKVLEDGKRRTLTGASEEAERERELAVISRLRQAAEQGRKGRYDARDLGALIHQPELIHYQPKAQWEKLPITPGQRQILTNHGIDVDTVAGLGHAAKLLEALRARRDQGLADTNQLRELLLAGHTDAAALRYSEAKAALNPARIA